MSLFQELTPGAVRSPGDYVKAHLDARGWTQEDLARVIGRPLPTVNEVIKGKRAVMPEMALALASAFGESAEEWVKREALYRLSLAATPDKDVVARRARLYSLAPIKDMQKRGWVTADGDLDAVERDVLRLLEIDFTAQEPAAVGAMRKGDAAQPLNPAQRAWYFRVRQMAAAIKLSVKYDPARVDACQAELRRLAAYTQTASKVAAVLGKYGIRLVVVEPLPGGTKVDGVATWLSEDEPVIGLTLRYDRLDSFWFTLGHELIHIRHRDAAPLDTDLTAQEPDAPPESPMEARANEESAAMFIPPAELKSFILRHSPIYPKERINQFANRIKVHPGLIVGQLQRRREIGYHTNRDTLKPIRSVVTSTALTDGWGQTIDPEVFR